MNYFRYGFVAAALVFVLTLSSAAQTKGTSSLIIVYKDHHERAVSSAEVSRVDLKNDVLVLNHGGREEQIPLSDVARIDVHAAASAAENAMARSSFVGKWEVGMGGAPGTFRITLDRDGQARKSIDSHRGRWTYVDGEARIEWDDGWHDVIAKVGNRYEKRAYAPGKSYSEPPANIADAKRANDQSI